MRFAARSFPDKPLSRAYNIGLDKAYASEDLTQAIRKALPDLKFEIGQHQRCRGRPHRNRDPLDISRANEELGWTPKIYLEEGIARLAAWLNKHKAQLRP